MYDQDYVALDLKGLKPGIEVTLVICEPVSTIRRRSRIAHPDIVRRKTAPERQQIGNDVAPQVGRRGITVEKNDRIPVSDVHVGHLRSAQRYVFPVGNVFR